MQLAGVISPSMAGTTKRREKEWKLTSFLEAFTPPEGSQYIWKGQFGQICGKGCVAEGGSFQGKGSSCRRDKEAYDSYVRRSEPYC